jgi:hypothetical protein
MPLAPAPTRSYISDSRAGRTCVHIHSIHHKSTLRQHHPPLFIRISTRAAWRFHRLRLSQFPMAVLTCYATRPVANRPGPPNRPGSRTRRPLPALPSRKSLPSMHDQPVAGAPRPRADPSSARVPAEPVGPLGRPGRPCGLARRQPDSQTGGMCSRLPGRGSAGHVAQAPANPAENRRLLE